MSLNLTSPSSPPLASSWTWHGWTPLDVLLSSLSIGASLVLWYRQSRDVHAKGRTDSAARADPAEADAAPTPSLPSATAWILPAYVHHARMLPKTATHAFRYPALYLAVPLSRLEAGECDVGWGGRVFRWRGSSPRSALTSIEAGDYLGAGPETSWLQKLERELLDREYLSYAGELQDKYETWAVTMPSFLGMHGINPLTVYYVHGRDAHAGSGGEKRLRLCLLEVHNTFGERHIYVLVVGQGEDQVPVAGEAPPPPQPRSLGPIGDGLSWPVPRRRGDYEHQWTFPRSFHVSPFNDRGGYYRLCLKSLFPTGEGSGAVPRMDIRLLLLVPSHESPAEDTPATKKSRPHLEKKILATLNSYHPERNQSIPRSKLPSRLTAQNLLAALARQPLDLTLTFPRIAWQAAKLHYGKKLDVFGKPEMSVGAGAGPGKEVEDRQDDETQNNEGDTELTPDSDLDFDFDGVGWPISCNATQLEREAQAWTQAQRRRDRLRRTGLASVDASSCSPLPPLPLLRPGKTGALAWPEPTHSESLARDWFLSLVRHSPTMALRLVRPGGELEVLPPAGSRAEEVAEDQTLTIYMTSPSFYTDMALYLPLSSHLALLLGSRVARRWGVNDVTLFHRFFAELAGVAKEKKSGEENGDAAQAARVRMAYLRWGYDVALSDMKPSLASGSDFDSALSLLCSAGEDPSLKPATAFPLPLDTLSPPSPDLTSALAAHHRTLKLIRMVFRVVRARYVKGEEPWLEVGRGLEVVRRDAARAAAEREVDDGCTR